MKPEYVKPVSIILRLQSIIILIIMAVIDIRNTSEDCFTGYFTGDYDYIVAILPCMLFIAAAI